MWGDWFLRGEAVEFIAEFFNLFSVREFFGCYLGDFLERVPVVDFGVRWDGC